MPDGVIYKPCGNRRASACPSCSKRYKRDAYQIIRTMPGRRPGRARNRRHTSGRVPHLHRPLLRRGPHPRHQDSTPAAIGAAATAGPNRATPAATTPRASTAGRWPASPATRPPTRWLGTPLCLDCYDHDAQVVWNLEAGELWRRTRIAILRFLQRRARQRGIDPAHDQAVLRQGRRIPTPRASSTCTPSCAWMASTRPTRTVILPPAGLDVGDLVDAIDPRRQGDQRTPPTRTRPGRRAGASAGASRSTPRSSPSPPRARSPTATWPATWPSTPPNPPRSPGTPPGGSPTRTSTGYADPDGSHTERLIDACWMLGRPKEWRRLRLWAHMLGFGGHFLTKSRRHVVTFALLRNNRIVFRRTVTAGPEPEDQAPEQPTTLVVNFLAVRRRRLAHRRRRPARQHLRCPRPRVQRRTPEPNSRPWPPERFTAKPDLTALAT